MSQDTLHYFKIESEELLETLYTLARALDESRDPSLLKEMRRAAHSLKGAARLVELYSIADVAHTLEDLLLELDNGSPVGGDLLLPMLDRLARVITDGLSPAPQELRAEVPAVASLAMNDVGITKVETPVLDEIARGVAQLLEIGERVSSSVSQFDQVARDIASLHTEATHLQELRKLRELLHHDLGLIRATSRQVHALVLSTKLTTFDEVRHRYEKLARDVARETGKRCAFEISGGETLLDQRILQRLGEPLAHLLRNAICHGIQREERGKSDPLVTFHVERRDQHIIITVTDNGRGLDIAQIEERSKRLGVELPPEEAIFLPGFSTSAEVTEISGRGIGLDVVRSAVEALGGELQVTTKVGEGTAFTLSLPTVIDLADVFEVEIGLQSFFLPLKSVYKVARMKELKSTYLDGHGGVWLENEALRIFDGARLLGITGIGDNSTNVVVLQVGGRKIALLVHRVLGRRQAVIKGLSEHLRTNPLLSGGGITTEGRIAFLLRPKALLERVDGVQDAMPVEHETQEKHSVLVVDDSLTTRMLEKRVLDGAGYKTTLACNGVEALKELEKQRFDLIIVDFEMPEMDGVNLTRHIRGDSRLSKTPIIMLTSRGDDEDKRLGLLAGVQAYLVKGNFDQAHFLSVVEDLIAMEGE